MPRLKGRVALVTGASRGIGRAIALALAAEGAAMERRLVHDLAGCKRILNGRVKTKNGEPGSSTLNAENQELRCRANVPFAEERRMRRPRFRHHVRKMDLTRRVALRALLAFLAMFALLRALTAVIHFQLLPIHNIVTRSGLHIHHLFWGILLLMVTGFAALATRDPGWHLRIAVVFGCALALTLDEFALWLRLADVYWSREGLESIKAAAVAAAILGVVAAGTPLWTGIWNDLTGRNR